MSKSSTTSTFEWQLLKYSKSYSQVQPQVPADSWQHFTNPVIRLILDLRKADKGELESARVRIMWTIDTSGPPSSSQTTTQDVVFEDLELLTFSSLLPHRANPQQQSLPLKAVYRDAVVGIRYLHITPGNDYLANPVYRRFQITFASASSASQFIESIQTVCPCKSNPAPPVGLMNASVAAQPRQQTMFIRQPTGLNMPAPATPPRHLISRSTMDGTITVQDDLQTPQQPRTTTHQMNTKPTWNLMSSPNMWTSDSSAYPSVQQGAREFDLSPVQPTSSQISQHTPREVSSDLFSAPDSSAPAVSHDSPVEARTIDITRALKEATSIYSLPKDALERVVGDIVREDGFAKLLEDLDKLWNVKAFLN